MSTTERHRLVRVSLETARHRITGTLRLPAEGYRSRLTDYLNAREADFAALTDARVVPLDGSPPGDYPFLAVAVRHIVLAVELD